MKQVIVLKTYNKRNQIFEVEHGIRLHKLYGSKNEEELRRKLKPAHAEKENMLDACFKAIEAYKTRTMKQETSIVKYLKQKLDKMQEGYQYQIKYFNERTEEKIHEACRKVMRETEDETNLMRDMY